MYFFRYKGINVIEMYIKKGNFHFKTELEQYGHRSHTEQWFLYMKFVHLGRQQSSRKNSTGSWIYYCKN